MRPVELVLDGFSAFRSSTVVDFRDADVFALVGPTGAGKSSIIDGIVFALYGMVPRYDHQSAVAPVITQGRPEARVQLRFVTDGRELVATRVVRRTARGGATTREARLECGDEVLASDAKAVTARVTELLGLDAMQFTKCVVLPQGAFAALLHEKQAARDDLLVKLLDLGLYDRVASRVRQRRQDLALEVSTLRAKLDEFAGVDADALGRLDARVAQLERLASVIAEDVERCEQLEERLSGSQARLAELSTTIGLLDAVRVPESVAGLASRSSAASSALAEAEGHEAACLAALEQLEAQAAGSAALEDVLRLVDLTEALTALSVRIDRGTAHVAGARAEVEAAASLAEGARLRAAEAEAHLDRARLHDLAVALAEGLQIGDPCPVCGGTVSDLPEVDSSALAAAQTSLTAARAEVAAAEDAHSRSVAQLAQSEGLLAALITDRETAVVATSSTMERLGLAAGIDLEELRSELTARAAALEAAKADDRSARKVVAAARAARDEVSRLEIEARGRFHDVRDQLASLSPPTGGGDLLADWSALSEWAVGAAAELRGEAASLAELRRAVEAELSELRSAMVAALEGSGVAASGVAPERTVLDALAAARSEAEQVRAALDRVVAWSSALRTSEDGEAVHHLLETQLRADRFVRWLLAEVVSSLVVAASARLEQLSQGRYGLGLDARAAFEVIDHSAADERRSARSLSGGETFLASLALALALAEQVSELSSTHAGSLDAIFLDEGFGTLDQDSLDVVATALEELGAAGRMVGVVSHVRELAERVPIRFEVRAGADTATVLRIDA